ncbi:ABC transporter permease [Acidobacteriia bacterium AH_259_A11_L15]|nr:ABC transporter permease [Acidobacteriia bacterium AH_259_A11_L15]
MSWREKLALRWRRDVSENVWMALDTLRAHKVRSALTGLGIIIAVITVMLVVAILLGFDHNVRQVIQGYGTNTAFFAHHAFQGPRFGHPTKEERMRKPLSYEDFLAVQEACTACISTTVSLFPPEGPGGPSRARYKGEEVVGLDFRGATADFFSVYANAVVVKGRPFTQAESLHRVDVVVIGEDLAKGLFGPEDPLEKEILVNNHAFRVVGAFEKPKGTFGPGGQDTRAVVPYWTFRKVFPLADYHGVRIEAYPGELPVAIDQARVALRRSRRVAYDKPDNFDYATADSIIQNWHDLVGMIALVTSVLASVGLLVGGVGVMNIMLVSVTERTREIGVRKAIGARRRDIIWQFLSEAVTLAGSAGVVGVVIAYGLTALVVQRLLELPGFIPVWVVVLAVGVASSVGLFFGMYPAVKAARLDPVDALRYE